MGEGVADYSVLAGRGGLQYMGGTGLTPVSRCLQKVITN